MSIEALLAAENSNLLSKYGAPGRGRTSTSNGDRSLSPNKFHSPTGAIRSTSRGRSTSRRRNPSVATSGKSQGEDIDFKWSILNHDPSERFVAKDLDEEDEFDSDNVSEEEQISDDDSDFDFDINEIILPNFKISINDYYKKKSGYADEKQRDIQLQIEQNKKIKEENITKRAKELRELTEVLSLKKAVEAAQASGSDIPQDTITSVTAKLKELGIKDPERMNVDEVVDLENKKDKAYKAYKDLLIDKSKDTKHEIPYHHIDRKLIKSDLSINEENLRVSRTITLGDFFKTETEEKSLTRKSKEVDSYLIYMDLSPDSLNALQYTIGTIVKSGDVLYVINSADDEDDIDYYKKQIEKLTELVSTYLNLIDFEEFKLHVVVETTHHQYPKHFLNELIKYLKPNLFIVGYRLLLNELSNYISTIPILVVKKKVRRKTKSTPITFSKA